MLAATENMTITRSMDQLLASENFLAMERPRQESHGNSLAVLSGGADGLMGTVR